MKVGKRIIIAAVMAAVTLLGSSVPVKAAGKFDPAFYVAKYADVGAIIGTDPAALYNHYITFGQKEGRIPYEGAEGGAPVSNIAGMAGKFDAAYYASQYNDLRRVFGMNAEALYNHYILCGQREGRVPYQGAPAGAPVSGIATAAEIQASHEPVTYVVKYVKYDDDKVDWRFQAGRSAWKDSSDNRSLYYLEKDIRDGDVLIVENSYGNALSLKLSVSLSNLTVNHAGDVRITAKGVDNVYVLRDSKAVINGNVTNAYVYDNATANFNNSVTNLYIMEPNSNKQTIAVAGTVDYVENNDNGKITRQLYSFRSNTFRMENGSLKTKDTDYSVFFR